MLFNRLCNKKRSISILVAALIATSVAKAEIIIHGTRVIYPSNAREITLQVSNNGNHPALVQAWIDDGNAKLTPEQSDAPFIISPPITRVEAQKGQALRISSIANTSNLSQTQETLFWLNILDIPPRPSVKSQPFTPENYLQLAIRSRIKLLYRPSGIKDNVALAPEKLQWFNNSTQLTVHNPSPFYISLTSIKQPQPNNQVVDLLSEGLLLKPFAKTTVRLNNRNVANMTFTIINDYGGRIEYPIKWQ